MGRTSEVNRNMRSTIIRSFDKSGMALPADGSRDHEINIESLENYEEGEENDIEGIEFDSDLSASDDEFVQDDVLGNISSGSKDESSESESVPSNAPNEPLTFKPIRFES